jgi:hypothetical protein
LMRTASSFCCRMYCVGDSQNWPSCTCERWLIACGDGSTLHDQVQDILVWWSFSYFFFRLTRLLFQFSCGFLSPKSYGALWNVIWIAPCWITFPRRLEKLDEPEMIDEPDLDTYVFIKTKCRYWQ